MKVILGEFSTDVSLLINGVYKAYIDSKEYENKNKFYD
jgi:hypothetical protein